jgi:hypothetical protein
VSALGFSISGMTTELISIAGGLLTTVIAAWVGYLFGVRTAHVQQWRAARSASALDLAEPLRELRALVRRHGRADLTSGDVAAAYADWAAAFDRNAHRLPDGWRHLSRSVRAAVGTVFGGITFVDLRPDAVELALEGPDFTWQDFADDYLDYAVYWLLRWGDSTTKRRQELWDYDTWLVRSERREPIGQNHSDIAAARRLDPA